MRKTFCWLFALYTVCNACYGERFCIANLSKSDLTIDSFDNGTMGVAEIGFGLSGNIFGTKRIDIPDLGAFAPAISPGEVLLLEFTYIPVPGPCVRPKCRLNVAGQQFYRQLELHNTIEMQIFGDVVVTEVELVQVVFGKEMNRFSPEILKRLSRADDALFVEDKANVEILDLVGIYPFYYSPWRVQKLRQDLAEPDSRLPKCQIQ
jgi:hypothetical protein